MTLDFFQIYFEDSQLEKLYPFATPYRNNNPSLLFENQVIAELVPKSTADLISVCSWRLRQKRGEGASEVILKNANSFELTEDKILQADFDIAILTPRNHKDIIEKLIAWHGAAARDALAEFRQFIKIPLTVEHAIYENHFIARREIYHDYVNSCLLPAIDFVNSRPIFFADSTYITKKKNPAEVKAFQEKFGRKDWPIAPFILERLFCIWANGKKFKYVNL